VTAPGALVFAAADALGPWLDGYAVAALEDPEGGWSATCKIAARARERSGADVAREQVITIAIPGAAAAPTSALARVLVEASAALERWGVAFDRGPLVELAAALAAAVERGEVGP
jgi:hypothetical protein